MVINRTWFVLATIVVARETITTRGDIATEACCPCRMSWSYFVELALLMVEIQQAWLYHHMIIFSQWSYLASLLDVCLLHKYTITMLEKISSVCLKYLSNSMFSVVEDIVEPEVLCFLLLGKILSTSYLRLCQSVFLFPSGEFSANSITFLRQYSIQSPSEAFDWNCKKKQTITLDQDER